MYLESVSDRLLVDADTPLGGLSGLDIFKNPTVIGIATTHNVSAAQVALKWLIQRNITVVTAADNPVRTKESNPPLFVGFSDRLLWCQVYIAEDMDLFSWGELTAAEMATLAAV